MLQIQIFLDQKMISLFQLCLSLGGMICFISLFVCLISFCPVVCIRLLISFSLNIFCFLFQFSSVQFSFNPCILEYIGQQVDTIGFYWLQFSWTSFMLVMNILHHLVLGLSLNSSSFCWFSFVSYFRMVLLWQPEYVTC